MTRFARAKGSKASNERLPEEATPWSEMKKQLLEKNRDVEESKSRKDALEKRNANYKSFLEEKEKDSTANSNWAEFPGSSKSPAKEKKKRNKKLSSTNKSPRQSEGIKIEQEGDDGEPPEEHSSKKEIAEVVVKKKKAKPKKLLKIPLEQGTNSKNENGNNQKTKPLRKGKLTENGDEGGIRKKSNKSVKQNNVDTASGKDAIKSEERTTKIQLMKKPGRENLTELDLKKIEKKIEKRKKQVAKKKKVKEELKRQLEEQKKAQENGEEKADEVKSEISKPKSFDKSLSKNTYPKKPFVKSNNFNEKQKKPRDNEEHPRKKPLLPHKMFINGKELEIDYVDGFPVKKEDALRLKKLRGEMISKGLPRSEINIALKLERRKAEKAFAREKKKVCFHCRKSGHNLSECPDIDKNEVAQTTASGICFKCGSTEHTHFECKVVRGQDFKYATCFICKEQGHIARQCPDNARGLYPKGGACKVCGDVTHLKKDCPKYQAQQQRQEESLRIETLGHNNPDMLEEKSFDKGVTGSKKPNKIIKF